MYKDPEKQKEYQRKHFQDNKNKYREQLLGRRQRNREYIYNIKLKSKCCKCGETYPDCLDFHHVNAGTKFHSVSYLTQRAYSIKVLQKEIDKCEVICSNCHRAIHDKRNQSRGEIIKWFVDLKLSLSCKNCNKKGVGCLDFHHTDPKDKQYKVSFMVQNRHPIQNIQREIDKCEVLCSNCHRKIHSAS